MSNEINEKCTECQQEIEYGDDCEVDGDIFCHYCYENLEQDILFEYADEIGELMIEFMRENYGLFAKEIEKHDEDLNQLEDEEERKDLMISLFQNTILSTLFETYVMENSSLSEDYVGIISNNIFDGNHVKYIHRVIEEYNELINAPVLK